jgi:hypothetical protein
MIFHNHASHEISHDITYAEVAVVTVVSHTKLRSSRVDGATDLAIGAFLLDSCSIHCHCRLRIAAPFKLLPVFQAIMV